MFEWLRNCQVHHFSKMQLGQNKHHFQAGFQLFLDNWWGTRVAGTKRSIWDGCKRVNTSSAHLLSVNTISSYQWHFLDLHVLNSGLRCNHRESHGPRCLLCWVGHLTNYWPRKQLETQADPCSIWLWRHRARQKAGHHHDITREEWWWDDCQGIERENSAMLSSEESRVIWLFWFLFTLKNQNVSVLYNAKCF